MVGQEALGQGILAVEIIQDRQLHQVLEDWVALEALVPRVAAVAAPPALLEYKILVPQGPRPPAVTPEAPLDSWAEVVVVAEGLPQSELEESVVMEELRAPEVVVVAEVSLLAVLQEALAAQGSW